MMGDEAVRAALGHSLHLTFCAVFLTAVLTLLLATLVPSVAITTRAGTAAQSEKAWMTLQGESLPADR